MKKWTGIVVGWTGLLALACGAAGETCEGQECVVQDNTEPAGVCEANGSVYPAGAVVPHGAGNSCICLEDGELGRCTGVTQAFCKDNGVEYAVGDVIPRGGYSCSCLKGGEIGQCTGLIREHQAQ